MEIERPGIPPKILKIAYIYPKQNFWKKILDFLYSF